jgi:hypothetical protein
MVVSFGRSGKSVPSGMGVDCYSTPHPTRRNNREPIMGVSVRETTADTRIVTLSVMANSRNRRPTTSPMNNKGISAAISEIVNDTMVKPICSDPFNAAWSGLSPSSMKRTMFSIITMASSTTKPVEIVNAMRVRG